MRTLRALWRIPSARLALVVLLGVALLAVLGGTLAPHDPLHQYTDDVLQGPSSTHLLGTDYVGRDVLSRLMEGTRLSVVGAVEAVLIGAVLGVPTGLASAWLGPRLEWLTLRVSDTLVILPFTVFAIAVAGTLGNGLQQAMIAIGILISPIFFRVTRAAALGLRKVQYVEAAELMGATEWWTLRRHIWTKVLPNVAVTAAHATGAALLVVASLAFLGLGVTPPAPTWGGMLSSDLGYLAQQPWAPIFPALLMMATVGSLNLLADAIRDATGATEAPRRRRPTPPVREERRDGVPA
ncbi:ABC transporter permease subunit [Pimelobacter simplex]|uniref:Dipeptide transport system permease protein DppC n=1 Tax=Nocardioides simplex TaxID=2045 RepID=A0A0A1DPK2_NOCSI|nr:ABC transporter permease [Pimelobacter simplex]AIY19309.1 Dipeptide transport system permease protein DppC [Pimelobacter simplex]MCG8149423.1 ABC transporter permease subunit [Pimelobacter simplex]GEB16206.1 peptide ABC transporter permease [Pimelobacter simplex]SFM19292.1 peptide/nickel transport system permease protein [Pimelobacter simplex]